MTDKRKKAETYILEDARIAFRNFSGAEGRYNAKGNRNFAVLLREDEANDLLNRGWNVKYLQPRDEDEEPQPYIQVALKYTNIPPRVVMITSRGKTDLSEDMVSMLDFAEIRKVDLSIRAYHWEVNGNTGIKAYVKNLFVTIEEDALEEKYSDVPDSAKSALISEEED